MRHLVLGIFVAVSLSLVACGDSLSRGSPESAGASYGDSAGGGAGSAGASANGGTTTTPSQQSLTAGAWDDNVNYAFFEKYRDGLGQQSGLPQFTKEEQSAAHQSSQSRSAKAALDVAFIIDTTGSMGDEISYLQKEFEAISQALQTQHPNVPQRWSLVAYRDVGDDYEVRSVDFTSGVQGFSTELGKLGPGGGGDFPEAPDLAFARARDLSWSTDGNTARLAFWVADAPHHDDKAAALVDGVRQLRELGVHVYPVASSGIDELTEYTMRATAQLTLGRYLFLTDDSGIGEAHKDPSIPCYVVTRLDDAVLRSVSSELTGTSVGPNPAAIIRSVGEPKDGVCTLADGEARVF